jgi:Holliday junction DNA helicase RuvA
VIAFLEGTVAEKGADRVVVSVGGTGYELVVPAPTLARVPAVGRRVRLFTRLQIRDEALVLYGFSTAEERTLFDHLITVNGVGPKAALALLSVLSPEALRRAIGTGDVEALTLAPGVGRKVANRVILDLREKVGGADREAPTGALAEVREALLSLGLSAQEARDALASLDPDGERSVEELLRQALRNVGTR